MSDNRLRATATGHRSAAATSSHPARAMLPRPAARSAPSKAWVGSISPRPCVMAESSRSVSGSAGPSRYSGEYDWVATVAVARIGSPDPASSRCTAAPTA